VRMHEPAGRARLVLEARHYCCATSGSTRSFLIVLIAT
jgi:hypothetical protein